jgi:1-hydroxycarotenoid 3,4-desaturase
MAETTRVVVVGAGIGGLCCALTLAHRGLEVTLVERAAQPGGKMRQVQVDGVGIDSGPTVFTMRWVLDQMLQDMGLDLDAELPSEELNILARHAWDGQDATLDLFADHHESAEAIGRFSGPQEAKRFLGFCQQARQLYDRLEKPYIRSERPDLLSMGADLGPMGLMTLGGLGAMPSLWQALAKHFHDPRLQQLFGRYATYCGSSPWQAPATLMLIAQVEMDGVWSVKGGMHQVAQTLSRLAAAQGVTLRYGCGCKQVLTQGGRVAGVRLDDDETLAADHVVFNGDVAALGQGLLGDAVRAGFAPRPFEQRSLSATTWSIRGRATGFPLVRHNVFFNQDYAQEFHDIFQRQRLPTAGTVYVCAQDRDDEAAPPHGAERLLCLVNAPARDHPPDESEIQACEDNMKALVQRCGLTLAWAPHQGVRTQAEDFGQLFPGSSGALYGPATHGWMSAFSRHSARSKTPGLYLAGGTVHPGPGVPMAAMSGRLAAATLMADLGLTKASRRVVISGGISTR